VRSKRWVMIAPTPEYKIGFPNHYNIEFSQCKYSLIGTIKYRVVPSIVLKLSV
jgi:hypothetical protein